MRRAILHGELEAGTPLTEAAVAGEYNVSRTPVREAFARLKNEGLIQDRPRGGLEVAGTSLRDVEEIFGLRRVLECYAMEQAFPRIGELDILRLEHWVREAEHFLAAGDLQGVFEANTRFHNYILEKTGNRRLKQIVEGLTEAILRYRVTSLHQPGHAEGAIRRHGRLVQALKAGDREAAVAVIAEDVEAGRTVLEAFFRQGAPASGDEGEPGSALGG